MLIQVECSAGDTMTSALMDNKLTGVSIHKVKC